MCLLNGNHNSGNNGVLSVTTTTSAASNEASEEYAGQNMAYEPLHQVASTFSEVVDVAGE